VFHTASVTPTFFQALDAESFRNRQHMTAPFDAVLSGKLQQDTDTATFVIPMLPARFKVCRTLMSFYALAISIVARDLECTRHVYAIGKLSLAAAHVAMHLSGEYYCTLQSMAE